MISPQGYKLGEAPEAKNPFWGEGEDSNVNKIYATASVDDGIGVPSVTTSKTISGNDITFGFDFHNLKGKDGDPGKKGDTGFSPSARVEQTETGATITVTDKSGTTTATVENGTPGKNGFSPSARVEQTETGATITVTDKSGTTTATIENGAPGGKGDPGPAGPGVPAGGTAGQVLTKKSGTDYDTEWKDPTGGGSSGYMTFGGKGGIQYELNLQEVEYKTDNNYSVSINKSDSVFYSNSNGEGIDDTININGTINIPVDKTVERSYSYLVGGQSFADGGSEYTTIPLKTSDFTATLTSGNKLELTFVGITNVSGASGPSNDVILIVEGNVLDGQNMYYVSANINVGNLNVYSIPSTNIYNLEPRK